MASGSIPINGVVYTPQQILDQLKALIGAIDDTTQAYAAWRAQRLKQRQLEEKMHEFVDGLGASVRLKYGNDPKALADFSMEPPKKPGPKTPEVKAEAAVKGKATRAQRGTMGKSQRKKVKGE